MSTPDSNVKLSRTPADSSPETPHGALGRRQFLQGAGGLLAAAGLSPLAAAAQESVQQKVQTKTQAPNGQDFVQLSQIHDTQTDAPENAPGPFEPADKRVGFAIVGLGRLSIYQILPAFGRSKLCKPVALVSGEPEKAAKIAGQYGIKPSSLYTYANYDQLAQNPEVQVIYIVLPNSMHMEYTLRGAKAGKHILCEKPMATDPAECEKMIAACTSAKVKLMIAYRQQYEPMNREIVKMVKSGKLGTLRSFIATNSQNQGDPTQWRQKRALAGGGCLPDVGLYCLNAARFWSNEEPVEVFGQTVQPAGDPRFTEVEAGCNFTLRFPSGLLASCNTSYAAHRSQWARLEGSESWAELQPAFAYTGIKLRASRLLEGHETVMEPNIEEKDQFAAELDHMAECVLKNQQPHTPGEEGLQDHRLMAAIYESARTGRAVNVKPPTTPTRGPEPSEA